MTLALPVAPPAAAPRRATAAIPPAVPLAPGVEIVLDLSRLLSRVMHATPTGVDRCEMAYARGLLRAVPPGRLHFAAVHPGGRYGRLDPRRVAHFLDATERGWDELGHAPGERGWRLRLHAARTLLALRPRRVPRAGPGLRRVYVQASPHHLVSAPRVGRILAREDARFVCLVHDLIPIEYPEYARPGGATLHRRRMDTLITHAHGIVANSAATAASFARILPDSARGPEVRVAHLGIHDPRDAPPVAPLTRPAHPYFVCVGTIEPRKNHLLLLNLWRRMAETGERPLPRLVLVGRRGWENEQVVDMLERCGALAGHVEEHGRLADRDMLGLIAGARALLMPSFAEGYGMPVSEALALGTPVICSDLPALREAGGAAPTYLDPLDGAGWLAAIRAAVHATARPDARDVPPLADWAAHIRTLIELVNSVGTRA